MAGEGTRDLFEARLEDAIRKSNSGSVSHLPFLTMRERRRAERLTASTTARQRAESP